MEHITSDIKIAEKFVNTLWFSDEIDICTDNEADVQDSVKYRKIIMRELTFKR